MNYQETIEYLYSSLPIFQRVGKAAYKADLGNTLALDEHFNHPHRKFKSIHIAGTNGKGSTSHMTAAILQKAGYKVGLYTSPHLRDFRERIRINGEMIPKDEVTEFVNLNKDFFDKLKPSFFEMTVALAFNYFAKENIDIAVVEVGLGGRLDSTNIINPMISIITNIGLDHTDLLGDTLEKIAVEKAGIIKPNVPVIIGSTQPEIINVFKNKAKENNASITFADQVVTVKNYIPISDNLQRFEMEYKGNNLNIETDLLGHYQRFNIPPVLVCVDLLKEMGMNIPDSSIYEGLKTVKSTTGLMGRWQILGKNPTIVCDTGHNTDGIKLVTEQIQKATFKNLHMVIGMVADKNIDGILALLPKNAIYYFTQAKIPRALNSLKLKEKAETFDLKGKAYSSVSDAFAAAKKAASNSDLIFVGGSTFIVAEVV
ncbi:MAG TPA: folylpolyglutamate synthase/dihydrofolate synthase family protein [Tenuifilaceae bacterium]|nr:folylpolyglutamate synthase/dihydrofolate synthase family protein [Tenuifilaceae bacterium]